MAITKFETVSGVKPGEKSGGGGLLIFLGLAALASWIGYEYWYKPMKEEEAKKAASETKEENKTDGSA